MNSVRSFDKLTIYSLGDEITGEKGESLGRIEIVKDTVVAHVQEKFSTALSLLVTETAHEAETTPGDLYASMYPESMRSKSVQRTRTEKYREPLLVEEEYRSNTPSNPKENEGSDY
jgi:hypothetical protein